MEKNGTWPDSDLRRAFVAGAAWWECHKTEATMWASDRDIAEAEAERRYPRNTTILGFDIVIDPTLPDGMAEVKDGDRLLARIVGIAPNLNMRGEPRSGESISMDELGAVRPGKEQ